MVGIYVSTDGKPGSFKRFIKSVGATIKGNLTPDSKKMTYDLATGTATKGTIADKDSETSKVQNNISNDVNNNNNNNNNRGGGSSRSGGGSSSTQTNQLSTSSNALTSSNQVTNNTRQITTRQELLNKSNVPNDITISRTGRVRQGNREYIGNALVGDTGKTANQLSRETREQYKKETGQAIGQGRVSSKITYQTVEVEPGEVYSKDTAGEQIYFNSKPKPESIKDFMTPTEERKEYPTSVKFTTQPSKYENFSIWTAPLWAGEKIANTKAGVKVEEFLQSKLKYNQLAIKGTQFLEGTTRDLPKFIFFSPAMSTGAAATITDINSQIVKNNLRKETPELFLGVSRETEAGTENLIGLRRTTPEAKSETLIKFDTIKTGEETSQIIKGKGAQKVKVNKDIDQTKFTFFGDTQNVNARYIRNKGDYQVLENIKQPNQASFSDINILTLENNPRLIKSYGAGISKQEGEFTKVISGNIDKAYKVKTGSFEKITLPEGTSQTINLFSNPKAKVKFDSIGVIKKISPKSSEVVSGSQVQIKVSDSSVQTALQIEQKIFDVKTKIETKSDFSNSGLKLFSPTKQESIQINEMKPIVSPVMQPTQETKTEQISIFKPSNKSKGKSSQGTIQKPKPQESFIPKVDTSNLFSQEQRVSQVFKKAQLLKQAQEQRQVQRQTQINTNINNPKVTPTPKIKPEFSFKDLKRKVEDGEFQVLGKRFGQDITLLKTKDKAQAEQKLYGFLKGTLGRSGKILKDGKEISFDELSLSKSSQFTKAKKDPFRVVQKSEYSLGTGGEKQEIQYFKNKKKKQDKETNKKLNTGNERLKYILKKNQVELTIKDFKAPSILDDEQRFFLKKNKSSGKKKKSISMWD